MSKQDWHSQGRAPLRLSARPREQRTAKRGSVALPSASQHFDSLRVARKTPVQQLESTLADRLRALDEATSR